MVFRRRRWLALCEELSDRVLVADVLVNFAPSLGIDLLKLLLDLALSLEEVLVVASSALRLE